LRTCTHEAWKRRFSGGLVEKEIEVGDVLRIAVMGRSEAYLRSDFSGNRLWGLELIVNDWYLRAQHVGFDTKQLVRMAGESRLMTKVPETYAEFARLA
jgi:hypothetical protein